MPRTSKHAKTAKTVIYRHTSHAEWGLGTIVEENPAKVYVAFEDGVRRPFINEARYRELLVPVELTPEAAEETLAKIAKNAPKPVTAKSAKKPKKKAAEEEEEEVAEPAAEEEDADDDDSDA